MPTIILAIGFIFLASALFTKRPYLFGSLSLLAFVLYFIFFGSGFNLLALALLISGIVLTIIELVIPAFGLIGIVGILMIFGSLYLANANLQDALIEGLLGLGVGGATAYLLLRAGFESPLTKKMILKTSLTTERGYSSGGNYTDLLGAKGITVTALRPSGKVEFSKGLRVNVISEADYITIGQEVEVVKVSGSKIVVRRV